MTDSERLDWLEQQLGCGLISDDNGHWAISQSGYQNCPTSPAPEDIETTFIVEAAFWRPSIREAIDAAVEEGTDAR